MVVIDQTAARAAGVTLVRVLCTNTRSTTQRIRLENALEGPTWPPRSDGVVDPRWDGDRWEGVVGPERTVGIGFATPAPPEPPLVEVVSSDRFDPDAAADCAFDTRIRLAALDGWRPKTAVLEGDREP